MARNQRHSGHQESREAWDTKTELAQPLGERVTAYAVAAAAAGLGIMAGAQPAGAQIIYTPADVRFERGARLDINNDGVTDFSITGYLNQSVISWCSLFVKGAPGNGVRGHDSGIIWPARLAEDTEIAASRTFQRNRKTAMGVLFPRRYIWTLGIRQLWFLGLEFQIDGQAHYGWAAVLITDAVAPPGYRGVVKGYAYNTVPNQPILAGQRSDADFIEKVPPQPATLGLLALGAPGTRYLAQTRARLALHPPARRQRRRTKVGKASISFATLVLGLVAAFVHAQAPVPFINQPLVPDAMAPGGPDFTLTVNGTGFVSNSTVNWNGSPLVERSSIAQYLLPWLPPRTSPRPARAG
jgi:hypothetical protein